MVWNGHEIQDSRISDLATMLNNQFEIYRNNTRVVHARLLFDHKGKRIEIFCLCAEDGKSLEHILHHKKSVSIRALVGGARKWKEGLLKTTIALKDSSISLHAEKGENLDGQFVIHLSWSTDHSFAEVLSAVGHVPLPPYMTRPDEIEDKDRYQTVYAEKEGSVAAPTAGLHFDEALLSRLSELGHELRELTLHVGAGTFKPVSQENARDHIMHGEEIVVNKEVIQSLAQHKKPVLAIGTTSMRTLESLYWCGVKAAEGEDPSSGLSQESAYTLPNGYSVEDSLNALLQWMETQGRTEFRAVTHLYLLPGYNFRIVDSLFTNFHQPQSTLLMLVSAFIGPKWKELYQHALDNNYRFLSYGDAMLLNKAQL